MTLVLMFIGAAVSAVFTSVAASVTVSPTIIAVLAGSDVQLKCSSDSPVGHWCWKHGPDLRRVIDRLDQQLKVARNEELKNEYKLSELSISNVQMSEAGQYTCRDCDDTGGKEAPTQLVVLEGECGAKFAASENGDPNALYIITCELFYTGKHTPTIDCETLYHPHTEPVDVQRASSSSRLTYRKTLPTTPSLAGMVVNCTAKYSRSSDPNEEVPNDVHLWVSAPVKCPVAEDSDSGVPISVIYLCVIAVILLVAIIVIVCLATKLNRMKRRLSEEKDKVNYCTWGYNWKTPEQRPCHTLTRPGEKNAFSAQ